MTKKLDDWGRAVPIVLMMVEGLAITTPSWLNALPPCRHGGTRNAVPSPNRRASRCLTAHATQVVGVYSALCCEEAVLQGCSGRYLNMRPIKSKCP